MSAPWHFPIWYVTPDAALETNHLLNPSFDVAAAGLAQQWTQAPGAGAFTNANDPSDISAYFQRVLYTGAAGDTNADINTLISNTSLVGTVVSGGIWTGSIFLKSGAVSEMAPSILLDWYTSAGDWISASPIADPTLTSAWQMVSGAGTAPANASRVRMRVKYAGVNNGDHIDLYADNASLMKGLYGAPLAAYPDPMAVGAHWNGLWNASTSTKELCYPSAGKAYIEDTANAHATSLWSPAVAVTPGQSCTASALVEVLARAGGTLHCDVAFYTADGSYIVGYPIVDLSAVAAEAWHSFTTLAPAIAAYARLHFQWIGATGNCKASIADARLSGSSLKSLVDAINVKVDAGAQTLVHGPVGDTTSYACVHSPRVGYPRDEVAVTALAAFVTLALNRTP